MGSNRRDLLRLALLALDLTANGQTLTAAALAKRAHISVRHAQKVLARLSAMGLLVGKREKSTTQGLKPILWKKTSA
jgi:predicted DNA-binding transcriptional regulator YafY